MSEALATDPAASVPAPHVAGVGVIRSQFFLSYAVLGAYWPYLAVCFHERGLSDTQIATVIAVATVPDLVMPFVTTSLADTRLRPRHLLIGIYLLSTVCLSLLYFSHHFWLILLFFACFRVGFAGMLPLQDGINFSLQKIRRGLGLPVTQYYKIRVWGSIGYIFPSLLFYLPMAFGWDTDISIAGTAGLTLVGVIGALFFFPPLPRPAAAVERGLGTPSLSAARALFRPPLRIFTIAMLCLWIGAAGWNSFYPVYLKTELGLQDKWLGPLSTTAVIVEIIFMFGFGWAVKRFGLRRVMLAGLLTAFVRLSILAWVHNLAIALATQLMHGPWVIALFVVPPSFINRNADDHFRHSIHGIYRVLTSLAIIGGNLMAGTIKQHFGAHLMFTFGAGAALVALLLVWVAFHEEHRED